MIMFAVAAGLTAAAHVVAALQRPRLAVIVSGILWALYAYYEYLVATGILCDANCNIRVDLVFFIPILALATYWARQSYMGRQGPQNVVGIVLGVIGLFVIGLVAESFGYRYLSGAALVVILAIGLYAITSKLMTKRS